MLIESLIVLVALGYPLAEALALRAREEGR